MTNFQHTDGFSKSVVDSESGAIDASKLPKAYRDILKNAGIKKKDLKDPEFAPMIMETIRRSVKLGAGMFNFGKKKKQNKQNNNYNTNQNRF